MNPQNPSSGQMPNVPMPQTQFALIGASAENIRTQEASGGPWQQFLPQQDRENLMNRFLQALRQYTGVANDKIIALSRSFEQQCFTSAISLQAYYTMCSQKISQIASTGQQKAINQFQNLMQQQANPAMQAQKLQQMQQGNMPQLQGQAIQADPDATAATAAATTTAAAATTAPNE
ncbi:hypothetical protein DSO57_1009412 [Entomophthora muscae]|uniref:Uncharacterized protein n=1 Tax=Entomophthora muscae TaxID=34485 RepID=A0ACC2U5Y3_9FUNG|nr:hypothetical protein DSO57_1009412 [Entomophthora muscae]